MSTGKNKRAAPPSDNSDKRREIQALRADMTQNALKNAHNLELEKERAAAAAHAAEEAAAKTAAAAFHEVLPVDMPSIGSPVLHIDGQADVVEPPAKRAHVEVPSVDSDVAPAAIGTTSVAVAVVSAAVAPAATEAASTVQSETDKLIETKKKVDAEEKQRKREAQNKRRRDLNAIKSAEKKRLKEEEKKKQEEEADIDVADSIAVELPACSDDGVVLGFWRRPRAGDCRVQ
jgi:hypothetical protein